MNSTTFTVEREIPAPPAAIFALLTNPAKHCEIDGSGTVRATKESGGGALQLGSTFRMSMRQGLPYTMVSEVVEFEQDRRIAWQSRPPGWAGRVSGGRTWRYELEPTETGTRVRETWDLSTDRQGRVMARIGPLTKKTKAAMDQTLARIETLVTETA